MRRLPDFNQCHEALDGDCPRWCCKAGCSDRGRSIWRSISCSRERAEARAKEWGISPKVYTGYEDVLKDTNIDAVELRTLSGKPKAYPFIQVEEEAPAALTWRHQNSDCLGILWVTRCTGEMLDLPPVMLFTGTESKGIQGPMDWMEIFIVVVAAFIQAIRTCEQPMMLNVTFYKQMLQSILAAYNAAAD